MYLKRHLPTVYNNIPGHPCSSAAPHCAYYSNTRFLYLLNFQKNSEMCYFFATYRHTHIHPHVHVCIHLYNVFIHTYTYMYTHTYTLNRCSLVHLLCALARSNSPQIFDSSNLSNRLTKRPSERPTDRPTRRSTVSLLCCCCCFWRCRCFVSV